MKKKGFTLVEMLVVVGVLGIIITIAGASIVSSIRKGSSESNEMMEKNLADAALTYGVAKIFLKKCTVEFAPSETALRDPNDENNACTKAVEVSFLIDNAYFEDENGYCDLETEVILYNYVNKDGYAEYKAYVPKGTCDA